MKLKGISIALALIFLIWIGFIFCMSSQTAENSGQMSQSVTKELVLTGEKVGILEEGTADSAGTLGKLDSTVRKVAHMGMYFVLACIIFAALWAWQVESRKSVILSLIACTLVSILDEINQMNFAGRNSGGIVSEALGDLSRDAIGALTALIIFILIRSAAAKMPKF